MLPAFPGSTYTTAVHEDLNPSVGPKPRAKNLSPVNHVQNPSTQSDIHPSRPESDTCGDHAGEWLLLTPDVQNLEVNLLDFSNDDIAGPIEEETLVVPSIQPGELRPSVDNFPVSLPLPVSHDPMHVQSSS